MKQINISILIAVTALTASIGNSLKAQVTNGDFSAGMSGWTVILAPGNTQPPEQEVAPFDTDGPGPLGVSDAFHVGVGDDALLDLQQSVQLTGGVTYSLQAVLAMTPPGNNADGGTVSAFIGMTLVASHSFGSTTARVNEYADLSGTYQPASTGPYTLSINFSRGYGLGRGWNTPSDWIDNVRLGAVPEPSSAAIALSGGCALAFFARRSGTKQQPIPAS